MIFNEFKNHVIAACKDAGITEYELYYSADESTSVETFRHEINEFTASRTGGVCFRCIVNGRMGYASTLLKEGVRLAEEKLGADTIRIEAQTYAMPLYEQAGFVAVSEEYLEDGIPHVTMLRKRA